LRNLSEKTRNNYWWHIADYESFCKKDPEETGVTELRAYFQKQLTDGKHKPSTVKMGYFALKFLFEKVYHKVWAKAYLPTPKVAQTLPLVLARCEVEDVLKAIPNFKHRTIIMFIYSTGARVAECVNIKLSDIDSKRMQVNIHEGKGLKQRQVPLSPVLLDRLRRYFKKEKPSVYLFEGAKKGCHISVSAVREICVKARYRTPHIKKQYTPHTFRHSFATHHLEAGTNLLLIQQFMGHSDLRNTLKYLHVQQLDESAVKNPLDSLSNIGSICKDK
jgi:integrase/recombinase XerD